MSAAASSCSTYRAAFCLTRLSSLDSGGLSFLPFSLLIRSLGSTTSNSIPKFLSLCILRVP